MGIRSMVESFFSTKVNSDSDPDIGNVYEDLKERVTNPLLMSYSISFFFCNWQVWIALFFEDKSLIKYQGGYVNYVGNLFTFFSVFVAPFSAALFYVFIFPIVRNYIKIVQAKFITANNKKINEIANGGVVPVDRFIKSKTALINSQKEYQALINEEIEVKKMLNDSINSRKKLESENLDLKREVLRLNESDSVLDRWKKNTTIDRYIGIWKIVSLVDDKQYASVKITDDHRVYHIKQTIIANQSKFKEDLIFNISGLFYDPNAGMVVWRLERKQLSSKSIVTDDDQSLCFIEVTGETMRQVVRDGRVFIWSQIR